MCLKAMALSVRDQKESDCSLREKTHESRVILAQAMPSMTGYSPRGSVWTGYPSRVRFRLVIITGPINHLVIIR